MTSIREKPNRL